MFGHLKFKFKQNSLEMSSKLSTELFVWGCDKAG